MRSTDGFQNCKENKRVVVDFATMIDRGWATLIITPNT